MKNSPKVIPTDQIKIKKYLGTWNEITSIPAFFSKGCKNSKAVYTPIDDKTIEVNNTCDKIDDNKVKQDQVIGEASLTLQPNVLKVQFGFPTKTTHKIFNVKSPYTIEYVDEQNGKYQNAIVGGRDKKYLWILSREKTMDEKTLKRLKELAKNKGYDINKLFPK